MVASATVKEENSQNVSLIAKIQTFAWPTKQGTVTPSHFAQMQLLLSAILELQYVAHVLFLATMLGIHLGLDIGDTSSLSYVEIGLAHRGLS
jgi:hypothetical protein